MTFNSRIMFVKDKGTTETAIIDNLFQKFAENRM